MRGSTLFLSDVEYMSFRKGECPREVCKNGNKDEQDQEGEINESATNIYIGDGRKEGDLANQRL